MVEAARGDPPRVDTPRVAAHAAGIGSTYNPAD